MSEKLRRAYLFTRVHRRARSVTFLYSIQLNDTRMVRDGPTSCATLLIADLSKKTQPYATLREARVAVLIALFAQFSFDGATLRSERGVLSSDCKASRSTVTCGVPCTTKEGESKTKCQFLLQFSWSEQETLYAHKKTFRTPVHRRTASRFI